jgi:monovalent cation/hydrogen antiporter
VQGSNVWSIIGFVLNGIVFLLIGLQLPIIINRVEGVGLKEAIGYGFIISLVLIITRLLSAFGAAAFTKFMGQFITVADRNPGWKVPLIFGWAGMRGVVSLAAALSIPVLVNSTEPFPFRNLILVITFIVILVTLVFQGLTLPWLIRKVNPAEKFSGMSVIEQEILIQRKMAEHSLKFLEEKYSTDLQNEHMVNLQLRLRTEWQFFSAPPGTSVDYSSRDNFQHIYLDMLEQQRKLLDIINHKAEFDEDLVRKYFALVDLEEYKIREKQWRVN